MMPEDASAATEALGELSGSVAQDAGEPRPPPAAAGAEDAAERRSRSRSSSSSGSRSSSSSSRARSPAAKTSEPSFVVDERVEVFGLQSDSGQSLNGRIGVVTQFVAQSGRYEVKFGPEQLALLRPDRLRRPSSVNAAGAAFAVDDRVEVVGLASDSGRLLNGQTGFVLRYVETKDRYEVKIGLENVALLKAANLRRAAAKSAPAAAAAAASDKPKASSLAGLLGLGKKEEKKEEPKASQWQSVWERSGAASAAEPSALTEDQQQFLKELYNGEENKEREAADIRKKVETEFAQAGVFDEGMIEQAVREQLEHHNLQKLLRPKDHEANAKRRRASSSSSSSSPRYSHSRSRPRTAAAASGAATGAAAVAASGGTAL